MLIDGARILRADGTIAPGSLALADGRIAAIDGAPPRPGRRLDGRGLLALPGIVDIHGDAFERQVMPRPGVAVPLDIALEDTDRQMLASGITTAFHGVTCSWEPGLRSLEACRTLIEALPRLAARLACDTRIHLRFETYALDALDPVATWIAGGCLGLLAFNDHTPDIHAQRHRPDKAAKVIERSGLDAASFTALVEQVAARADAVPAALERLAAAARRAGLPLLSHDDDSPERRRHYHRLGCTIAEFPETAATARAARALGNPVVLGAPNVLRGGSHHGAVCATAMVEAGLCTVLASDYYYPALLNAAFLLAQRPGGSLAAAWALVSANPARATGLDDRGTLAPGKRADLVLVDDGDPRRPRLVATLVAGRPVFTTAPERFS